MQPVRPQHLFQAATTLSKKRPLVQRRAKAEHRFDKRRELLPNYGRKNTCRLPLANAFDI